MYNILWLQLFISYAIYACTMTMTNLDLQMKKLSIVDGDFIDSCDYLETDNDSDHTLDLNDDLNIIQLNIRGLTGKQQTLIQETTPKNSNKKIDIYILCETWLNEHNNGRINVPNYSYIGKQKKQNGRWSGYSNT